MSPQIARLISEGESLLKRFRHLQACDRFFDAWDLSGHDRTIGLRIAEIWRLGGWEAMWKERNPENALYCFRNAQQLYRDLDPSEKLAEVERGMGIAASMLGNYAESLDWFNLAEHHTGERLERLKIWNMRCITLSYMNRDAEAEPWIRRVMAVKPGRDEKLRYLHNQARQSYGILLLKRGRPREALPYIRDKTLRAWAHLEAGHYHDVLRLVPDEKPRGHSLRAEALLALGREREALRALAKAERLLEDGRDRLETEDARGSFLSTKPYVSHLFVRLYARRGEWAKAFAKAERSRARSFLDFLLAGARQRLLHGHGPGRRSVAANLKRIEELRKKDRRTPEEERELSGYELEHRNVLRRAEKEGVQGLGVLPTEVLSVREIANFLPEGRAILQYQDGGDAIYAFVLRREGLRGVRLPANRGELLSEAAAVPEVISLAREEERTGRSGLFDWHMGRLGRMLLGSVPLEGVRELVVVPHGPIHNVPFAALKLDGAYIAERLSVSLSPSATIHAVLAERARRTPRPRWGLFVGDPTGTLPHAERERGALESVFGRRIRVMAGDEATPEAVAVAAGSAGVAHFATHAVFHPDRPEFSHLVLAEGRCLYAFDVMRRNLRRTRLVVLSACESGRGDFTRGEELFGLPRAFLRAGVPAVVATLWPVEDHPVLERFMKTFYERLAKLTPAGALREAQAVAIARGTPPSLWAGFVVIGA